ncbi:MAG TPA: lytic murein transglycosylase B [Gammaproteobacteria bacterium]|jgi:membrane-bound lytic murein transglycosylase B|nr:lytic murein transglycosylase B [Gammaproteobacteria bacterium]HAJ29058.1 lytic murein transglycosylase B [Gammaproteobacteria bacterium]
MSARMTQQIGLLAFLAALYIALPAPLKADYTDRPEVLAFISELTDADGFDRAELLEAFEEASYKQSIIDAISRPAERVMTWATYQDIFLTKARVEQGKAFEEQYRDSFDRAEAKWGVDRWVILAILGVETSYGRNKGRYRVIDALTTLAFDYPPRSGFFRKELRELFLLAREQQKPVTGLLGSYAGAMGYGQFIPSSYRAYAVDFTDDAFIDIWDEPVDAIASIANYLAVHGWQKNGPILVPMTSKAALPIDFFNQQLKPSLSAQKLTDAGIALDESMRDFPALKAAPLHYEGKAGAETWLGFQNFYAITRYNRSRLYAMAVFQLSERLKAAAS